MNSMTLKIDPDSKDLVFDANGVFQTIYDSDVIVQNVRHALVTWKAEFFTDENHGTDYERLVGLNQNSIEEEEVKEVIREAIFQEPGVSRIDALDVSYGQRVLIVVFSATLTSGEKINMEVTV